MPGFFDRNDTRSAKSRDALLFRNLKTIIAVAKPRAAGLRRLLRESGVDTIAHRDDLLRLPILRRREIDRLRADEPPFGGFVATRLGAMRRLTPDSPQGHARDWWNCARAMAAAGFEKNDIVLNCFSYHLSTDGHIVDEGAAALGCAVIPAGGGRNVECKVEAVHALRPNAYCGDPHYLLRILDAARDMNRDVSSIRKALVFGPRVSTLVRAEVEARGVRLRQAYVTAEHGVIAYESDLADGGRNDGMIVSENVFLEIVRPGSSELAPEGEIGEVVVTRVNADYPLLRRSTGHLSRILPGASPCGRTAPRIAGWLGRADEIARIGDKTIMPAHVLDLLVAHPSVRRLQLVLGAAAAGSVTLRAECANGDPRLIAELSRSLSTLAGEEGRIEIVAVGALTDQSKIIVDERR